MNRQCAFSRAIEHVFVNIYFVCAVSDQMDSFKLIAAIYNAVYLFTASFIQFFANELFKWDNMWLLAGHRLRLKRTEAGICTKKTHQNKTDSQLNFAYYYSFELNEARRWVITGKTVSFTMESYIPDWYYMGKKHASLNPSFWIFMKIFSIPFHSLCIRLLCIDWNW